MARGNRREEIFRAITTGSVPQDAGRSVRHDWLVHSRLGVDEQPLSPFTGDAGSEPSGGHGGSAGRSDETERQTCVVGGA
jgi:hypothetical protein